MKLILSKIQWNYIGKHAGWLTKSAENEEEQWELKIKENPQLVANCPYPNVALNPQLWIEITNIKYYNIPQNIINTPQIWIEVVKDNVYKFNPLAEKYPKLRSIKEFNDPQFWEALIKKAPYSFDAIPENIKPVISNNIKLWTDLIKANPYYYKSCPNPDVKYNPELWKEILKDRIYFWEECPSQEAKMDPQIKEKYLQFWLKQMHKNKPKQTPIDDFKPKFFDPTEN